MLRPTDDALDAIAHRIASVQGIVGVVLGGSRARGAAVAGSDTDLGLVYRPTLDVGRLRTLASELGGAGATLTEPGGWGPWVDGGGWLTIDGGPVDWIYRDADRIRRSLDAARSGEIRWHFQVGHPLGVPDFAYIAELALGRILSDPTGELASLRRAADPYPPALAAAVVGQLDEARFLLDGAGKGAARGDAVWIAGALFRVLGLCAHAIHARAERWSVNEKGAVAAAALLPTAPARFAERAQALLGARTPAGLAEAIEDARRLVAESAGSD